MRTVVFGLSLLLLSTGYARAQVFTTGPCPNFHADRIESNSLFGRQQRVCELRRTILPMINGEINMNPANGSIEIVGEDRQDIALEARVEAQSSSQADAESILRRIKIVTVGTIDGMGPTPASSFHGTWSISYSLRVPQHVNARIHSLNGSISLYES